MTRCSDDFLARPKDSSGGNSGLLEHSLKVAYSARELARGLGFEETVFYAGLLHDIGKLNPYYQIIFSGRQKNNEYLKAHAIFSALAVNRLKIAALSRSAQKQVLFAVAGHHSKLTQFIKSLDYIKRDETRFKKSLDGTLRNLSLFHQKVIDLDEFKGIDWEKCLRKFTPPLNETDFLSDGDFISDFLDFSSVFSVLIQADRGSFFEWKQPIFNINLNTTVLAKKPKSPISIIRQEFQRWLLSENTFQHKISILKAPTGIGKTKLFLDIINQISVAQCFERLFYFSPLLALTDDFESKLFGTEESLSVLNQTDAEKVLVYNHAFTGSLLNKQLSKDHNVWFDDEAEDPEFFKTLEYFERESFNKQFIITTTQRLLMILYSNAPADKEKLVSFKNSFLIIDEVQTIPKNLLPNFILLLKTISAKFNSRIILVSATIPNELQGLHILYTSKELEDEYMALTSKRIEYRTNLDGAHEVALLGDNERTIFMFNTRRKALDFFNNLPNPDDVFYLSSGVRKCDRSDIIQKRLKNNTPVTVVSTQVLEAGVDVSFSRMFREMAPLDNIVQAMGRLSREGECNDPVLTIFNYDGDYKPYSELEFKESQKRITSINSSIKLYDELPCYYKTVFDENMRNKNLADNLNCKMSWLDFEGVWDFVKKNALPADLGDPILVPRIEEYDEIKRQFLSSDKSVDKGKLYTRYAELVAQLPSSFDEIGDLHVLFDEELLDKGILLPKKEKLDEVYDPKVGLDKWVKI